MWTKLIGPLPCRTNALRAGTSRLRTTEICSRGNRSLQRSPLQRTRSHLNFFLCGLAKCIGEDVREVGSEWGHRDVHEDEKVFLSTKADASLELCEACSVSFL